MNIVNRGIGRKTGKATGAMLLGSSMKTGKEGCFQNEKTPKGIDVMKVKPVFFDNAPTEPLCDEIKRKLEINSEVEDGEDIDFEGLFKSWNQGALSSPWYIKTYRWVARKFSDRRFRWNPGFIWWIRHRTTNRYHVVGTGLPPGYYDKDIQMLYACFWLLVRFVEHECGGASKLEKEIKYGGYHADMVNECLAIYWWWTEIRPRRGEEDSGMEDVYDAKDDEMLIRLMKIRRFLWT